MRGWNISAQSSSSPLDVYWRDRLLECFLCCWIYVEKILRVGGEVLMMLPSWLVLSPWNRHDGLVDLVTGGWAGLSRASHPGHSSHCACQSTLESRICFTWTRSVHRSSPCWVASWSCVSHPHSPTSANTKLARDQFPNWCWLSPVRFPVSEPPW